jgi:hypothetical protein
MKTWIWYGILVALACGLIVFQRVRTVRGAGRASAPFPVEVQNQIPLIPPATAERDLRLGQIDAISRTLSPAEKSLRVESIKRDYEDLRVRTAAEFADIVGESADGLNAFLRQRALLEREMRADLAALLSPEELEEFDLRESAAGHIVQELLGDAAVTDEQKRAVFRLQREYEERFALSFDSSPVAMLQREQARQQTQVAIREALGDEAFAVWLDGEGADFPRLRAFIAEHQLPLHSAMELWRAKSDYNLRRLEVLARPQITVEASRAVYADVHRQTLARVAGIIGTNVNAVAGTGELDWFIHP